MQIAYFAYREWAFRLLEKILPAIRQGELALIGTVEEREVRNFGKRLPVIVFDPKKELTLEFLKKRSVDLALFYGWSWMVPEDIVSSLNCVCLHPSLLPRYRGGSPIQHQILAGEIEGGLTLFRMDEGIDSGPVFTQETFSLEGSLGDIFCRIVESGTKATLELLGTFRDRKAEFKPQKGLEHYPPLRRRKPEESNIPVSELTRFDFRSFNNFVRMLGNPYPNATVLFPDGKKLKIQRIQQIPDVPGTVSQIWENAYWALGVWYLRLEDSYVKVIKFDLE